MDIPEHFALIGSDDEFMADRQAQTWFDSIKAEKDAETEVIDGRVQNVSDVETCIARFMQAGQNMSLFGEQKIVWLRQANFLGDNQVGRAEGTKKELEAVQSWLKEFTDPNTYLLISGAPIDRRKAFPKFFDKQSKMLYLATSKQADQLLTLVDEACKNLGVEIDEEATEALITRVAGNSRMIVNELEKLSTYLADKDPKRITYNLVNDMVSAFGETEFFELADAFYNPSLDAALASVKKHFFTHKDARPVLTNLQNRNRLLIQLRSLKEGQFIRLNQRQIAAQDLSRAQSTYASFFTDVQKKSEFHPFGQNPWYLSRLAKIAERISLRVLIDFQLRFIDAFSELINHPNEHEQVIHNLVMDCHQQLLIQR
jgi:DNA polymerase-3 subunit delta